MATAAGEEGNWQVWHLAFWGGARTAFTDYRQSAVTLGCGLVVAKRASRNAREYIVQYRRGPAEPKTPGQL